ncbi:hypothetical protein F511_36182 [Dorcoceras hygrometricum]|uniref:Uncharacterized protein n=1 Tax=Dorcoceras hygrometricum TaxID=472368 RepID=A0A2Z7BDS6_9LAMI|nr:hypothetical protein F511_36182 [Dorcoceras hygrometricum]
MIQQEDFALRTSRKIPAGSICFIPAGQPDASISDESESGSVGLHLLRRFVSYLFRRLWRSWKRIAKTSRSRIQLAFHHSLLGIKINKHRGEMSASSPTSGEVPLPESVEAILRDICRSQSQPPIKNYARYGYIATLMKKYYPSQASLVRSGFQSPPTSFGTGSSSSGASPSSSPQNRSMESPFSSSHSQNPVNRIKEGFPGCSITENTSTSNSGTTIDESTELQGIQVTASKEGASTITISILFGSLQKDSISRILVVIVEAPSFEAVT